MIVKSNVDPPKGEKIWVSYIDQEGGIKYIVTSKTNNRDVYFLYEVGNDGLTKISKNKNPSEFERMVEY